MFTIDLITVFFHDFLTHLADSRDQIRGDSCQFIRVRRINKDTNRQVHGHLFCTFLFPCRYFTEHISCRILIMQFVDFSALPEHLHITRTCFVTLFRHHLYQRNLIYACLQTDALSFLYIGSDLYDQFRIFS